MPAAAELPSLARRGVWIHAAHVELAVLPEQVRSADDGLGELPGGAVAAAGEAGRHRSSRMSVVAVLPAEYSGQAAGSAELQISLGGPLEGNGSRLGDIGGGGDAAGHGSVGGGGGGNGGEQQQLVGMVHGLRG